MNQDKMMYEDLKCEFCDGAGEISRDSDGAAVEYDCHYCKGTGIDQDQLRICFLKSFGEGEPCGQCGCSLKSHRDGDLICPDYTGGQFNGWLETKFLIQ